MPLHLLDNLINLSDQTTARLNLGLGTTDTPTFNGITLTSDLSVGGSATVTNSITANTINAIEYDVTGTDGTVKLTKDIRTWVMGTKTYSVNPPETTPRGLDFKPDGMMFYIIGGNAISKPVYAYSLSTAWDLSTVTGYVSAATTGFDNNTQEIVFSNGDGVNDGKYMYILGDGNNRIARWTLGDPWDITTTASSSPDSGQSLTLTTITDASTLTAPQGVCFSPDGTKMYIADDFNNAVWQFDLATPWSLAAGNVTYTTGNLLNVASQEGTVGSVTLNSDGTRLFITGTTSDRIHEYRLVTPYSLVGARYVGRLITVTSTEQEPSSIYYNDTVNKCFIVGSNQDAVREVIVTPQILMSGTRLLIESNPTSVNDRVSINSVIITDTTAATSNSGGTDGALIVNGGIGATSLTVGGAIVGSSLRVDGAGLVTFNTRSAIRSTAAGRIGLVTSPTPSDFTMLQLGPEANTHPAIKVNGTGIDIVRADQTTGSTSIWTDLKANNITATGKITAALPIVFPSYPADVLPDASTYQGGMIFVSDDVGGPTMAFSDGTNWLRVRDNAVISST